MNFMNILKRNAISLLIMLVVQYALGMYTNLFVQFPDVKDEETLWKFAWTQIPLAGHIILGFGLLAGSIVFLITVLKRKTQELKAAAITGVTCIFAAGASGALFVDKQNGLYSLLMALFFLGAFAAYAYSFLSLKNQN